MKISVTFYKKFKLQNICKNIAFLSEERNDGLIEEKENYCVQSKFYMKEWYYGQSQNQQSTSGGQEVRNVHVKQSTEVKSVDASKIIFYAVLNVIQICLAVISNFFLHV